MEGLPPGQGVVAAKSGEARGGASVELKGGAETTVELALPDSLETIAGRVVDPEGHALPGAKVRLIHARGDPDPLSGLDLGMGERPSATTGEDGRFQLSGIHPRNGWVWADAAGYQDMRTAVASSGETVVTLAPGFTVEGDVVTPEGAPAPKGTTVVYGRFRRESIPVEAGHFRSGVLSEGEWTFRAHAEGFGESAPVTVSFSEGAPP